MNRQSGDNQTAITPQLFESGVSPDDPPIEQIVVEDIEAPIEGAIRSGRLAGKSMWSAIWILALPVILVLSYGTSYIQMAAGFVAWLTIVFRGYLPEGVNSMMTFVNSFHARVLGYLAFLTDDYPPVGLERSNGTPAAAPAPVAPNV